MVRIFARYSRLGDYLFLVLIQSFLDPLGEAVIIGGVLIMFFADAAVELAGNGVRLCPKGAQLLQLVLEVILVKNVDGAGDLLEPGYREMGTSRFCIKGSYSRLSIASQYRILHCGAPWRRTRKRFDTALIHLWETRHRPALRSAPDSILCQRRKAGGKSSPGFLSSARNTSTSSISRGFFSPGKQLGQSV